MKTIAENLQILKDSTDAIKLAIIDKGGNISGGISTWANSIGNLSGNSLLFDKYTYMPGIILNKLNGGTIGNPNTVYSLSTLIYTYSLSVSNITELICVPIRFVEDLGYGSIVKYHGSTGLQVDHKFKLSSNEYAEILYDYKKAINISIYNQASDFDLATKLHFLLLVILPDDHYDFDIFQITLPQTYCYLKNTNISLSNGITKKVQDITYNDELLVWNFDEGKFDKATPLWIKKKETALFYYKVTLENGIILNLVGSNGKCHRLFNYDNLLFESATDLVGKQVSTLQGLSKVVSVEKIEETCEYYNIITDYHMNCYANGVLTSCRYNNLYPIVNMKFDKSQVDLEPRYKIHAEKFKPNPEILPKYIRGMRLDENTTISIEDIKSYISNLERVRKNIDDFEENQEIVESIEEASVGWIDPEGNVYGYKLYMPGQMNHTTLADKICKKLGYKKQELGGYSKTLEDLGWCKFTDEFLLAVSDLTDRQEHKLTKFISNNPKVKKRGTIKLGNMFSLNISVNDIKKMSKKDLTHKMKNDRRTTH